MQKRLCLVLMTKPRERLKSRILGVSDTDNKELQK